MASEHTHIFLARRIRDCLDRPLQKMVLNHLDSYYLGSIFPDILFYSKDATAQKVAAGIHGADGQLTNKIIFDLIDRAQQNDDTLNFVFTAGLLTHFAVDITFHPIVFYFSGQDLSAKSVDDDKSAYRHMHYEAYIDIQINNRYFLDDIIEPGVLKYLRIYDLLEIEPAAVTQALQRQTTYYRLTRKRFLYHLFRAMSRLGLFPARAIAGFYANQKREKRPLPDPIEYRDVISGEIKQTDLKELVETAVQFGGQMIAAAYAYYTGSITRKSA